MIQLKQLLFLVVLVFLMVRCNNVPQKKVGIAYPDMISPLYYLDTIQIKDPRVVYIDSVAYITSQAILDSVSYSDLINTKGVVLFMGRPIAKTDYVKIYDFGYNSLPGLEEFSQFSLAINLDFADSIGDCAVYNFKIKPESFLLTLVADDVTFITNGIPWEKIGDKYGYEATGWSFSNKYELAMLPIYSEKDWRHMFKLQFGREPHWVHSLPRWAYIFYESCRHRIEIMLQNCRSRFY